MSTTGVDLISGLQRFTMAATSLIEGVGLVPIGMGLFGISEVILNLRYFFLLDILLPFLYIQHIPKRVLIIFLCQKQNEEKSNARELSRELFHTFSRRSTSLKHLSMRFVVPLFSHRLGGWFIYAKLQAATYLAMGRPISTLSDFS